MDKPLFLEQITDKYVRENFRRVEFELKALTSQGVQGEPGPAGPQGEPGYISDSAEAPTGGGSGGLGSVDITQFRATKFSIVVWNSDEDVTKYEEAVVLNLDDTTPGLKILSMAKFGSVIAYALSATINSGNIELTITNGELYDLSVEVTQQLFGSLT